ncbi:MAG TPA: cytochrome d ubiquinol oxidase subunit II, partial [Epsilonproteobacteria bacterium]|nr:cytochrome d ubiquinol oxidase subunit II [Campylobacterota bacterium]
EDQRDLIISALGRKWELTFTTLVMFGGAIFAAFPLFYATSFGGAYYVWMAILFCFIIQAVAYEYRKKPNNFFGVKTYEFFLFINGSLGIILIGIALGTLFTGGNFIVNEMNLSHWTKASYGLEGALNWFNLAFGFMLFFLARLLGGLYLINTIDNAEIIKKVHNVLKYETGIFLVLFLYVIGNIITMQGYTYDPVTLVTSIGSMKYLENFLALPVVSGVFITGVVLLLLGLGIGIFSSSDKGIWSAGIGTVFVVASLFLILGYNNTAYYPSLSDIQSSLTIQNSSSSHYTLEAMSYVSLLVPFVLGYIVMAWRVMNREKITVDEVKNDPHHY